MIPRTFEAWRSCIVNDCGIELNAEFIQKRLSVFTDPSNPETKKFIQHYGEQHLDNVVRWLKQA